MLTTKSEKELEKIRKLAEIKGLKNKKKRFTIDLVETLVELILFWIIIDANFWADISASNNKFILMFSAAMLIAFIFFLLLRPKSE